MSLVNKKSLRIIFFGTTHFSVTLLESLLKADLKVVAVVTQPDRPKGRRLKISATPVKECARKYQIPYFQPEKVKEPSFFKTIQELAPNLIVVAAFGQIFPKELLDYPEWGCWNVHASKLPYYRGPLPIQRSIMAGEKESGVSIMKMGEGVDDGDLFAIKTVQIEPEETAEELEQELAHQGANLLSESLQQLFKGSLSATPQEENLATHAPKLKKGENCLQWTESAEKLHNQIRALNPSPGALTYWKGQPLKIWRSTLLEGKEEGSGGEIRIVDQKKLIVEAGEGRLSIDELQLSGKKKMKIVDFLHGHPVQNGEWFTYVASDC